VCEHTFVLDSNAKGLVAEIEIELAAVRLGVPVLKPQEHSRCDLAFDIAGRIWKVQCKWGRLGPNRDVVIVGTGSFRLSTLGCIRTTYSENEVDLFGVYCGELDRSFLLPVSLVAGRHEIRLRLTQPRNKQRACITLADDFNFDGAIAQLGERCHGMAEVVGSSPTSSTSPGVPITVGANPFRDRFGYWIDRAAAGEEVLITRRGEPLARLGPAGPPDATRWNRQRR
jgi:prevent-host-death family protein